MYAIQFRDQPLFLHTFERSRYQFGALSPDTITYDNREYANIACGELSRMFSELYGTARVVAL